jgi:hypothetical protein
MIDGTSSAATAPKRVRDPAKMQPHRRISEHRIGDLPAALILSSPMPETRPSTEQ